MASTFPSCKFLALKQEGFCLTITLDRPDARNAMNLLMADELEAVMSAAAIEPDISAVVIRANGKHFCAGGDLKDMTDAMPPVRAGDHDPLYYANRRFGDLLTQINEAPLVVISVVHGAARGAGFGIACVSDIVIAEESANFAMPETGLGLPPAQILPFVAMRLGKHQARRLAFTGRPIGGEEAHRIGLIDILCADKDETNAALESLIQDIGGRGPVALTQAKQLIGDVGQVPLSLLLDRGARLVGRSSRSGEGREGLTAFVEKRKPEWAGRNLI